MPCLPSLLADPVRAAAAAAAMMLAGTAMAQPSPATESPAAAASPFFGLWELDLARMPDTYGPPPKRVTFAFSDAGQGQWLTKVEIMAPDGSVRRASVQYRRDGRMVRGEGDEIDGDSAAFNAPAPNVLVMSLARNHAPTGVRTYAISPDGREMTESAAGVDAEGAPFVRNFHFRRIGG
jgi:hypothetical protein